MRMSNISIYSLFDKFLNDSVYAKVWLLVYFMDIYAYMYAYIYIHIYVAISGRSAHDARPIGQKIYTPSCGAWGYPRACCGALGATPKEYSDMVRLNIVIINHPMEILRDDPIED